MTWYLWSAQKGWPLLWWIKEWTILSFQIFILGDRFILHSGLKKNRESVKPQIQTRMAAAHCTNWQTDSNDQGWDSYSQKWEIWGTKNQDGMGSGDVRVGALWTRDRRNPAVRKSYEEHSRRKQSGGRKRAKPSDGLPIAKQAASTCPAHHEITGHFREVTSNAFAQIGPQIVL